MCIVYIDIRDEIQYTKYYNYLFIYYSYPKYIIKNKITCTQYNTSWVNEFELRLKLIRGNFFHTLVISILCEIKNY